MAEIKTTRKDLKRKFERFRLMVALAFTNALTRNAPVDTGRLKNSINFKLSGDDIEITMVDYALFVEFGTPPHIITPKDKKALHWEDGPIVKVVRHPGTRPQPFIRNTLKGELPTIIKESLQKAFT